MEKVTTASNEETSKYGIEVIDVRIRRVDLPQENEASIYARMEAERKRQANKFRSEGEEEAQKIRAATDRDKTVILAEATRKSEILRGEGEAEAINIYSNAFEKDSSFYNFYRSMQAYSEVLGQEGTTMILSPDSQFLKFFNDSKGNN